MRSLVVFLLLVVAAALVAVGIVYFVEPSHALPSFFPGHSRFGHRHGVKHGIAAVVVGAVVLVIAVVAWPRRQAVSQRR